MLSTKLKIAAKNELEKDFFKLTNNSVSRKTMQNIRNHKDMKLETSRVKYAKYMMKPSFKSGYLFSKELFSSEIRKTETYMKKNKKKKHEEASVSRTSNFGLKQDVDV